MKNLKTFKNFENFREESDKLKVLESEKMRENTRKFLMSKKISEY